MNESIFSLQLGFIILFSLLSLKMGKETLIVFISILVLAANVFVLKQMHFLGLQVTCSDAFAIGSFVGLNLLREYFGMESARKAIYICFFMMLFFLVISQLHLVYAPTAQDWSQNAYETLFSPSPRLLFASLTVFFLVQKMDLSVYNGIKKIFPKWSMTLRNYGCLLISQIIDTLMFSFLGLYGLVDSIFDVILISLLLKTLIIFCLTPITLFSKKFLPKELYGRS